jgi:hypothetical protein
LHAQGFQFHFFSRRERGARGEAMGEGPRISCYSRMETVGQKKELVCPHLIWEYEIVRDSVL